MNIKNRRDQTEGEQERRMWEKNKKEEDDKRKWGGRRIVEMREEIHDARQTQGDEEMSIFTCGWWREGERDRPPH